MKRRAPLRELGAACLVALGTVLGTGLGTALAPACAGHAPARDAPAAFAYLAPGSGVRVVTHDGERGAPGTEGAETFAWDRGGAGFVVTRGGVLERVAAGGARRVVLDGARALRFPDVRARDGAIVVAAEIDGADAGAGVDGAWRVLLVERAGAPPTDLGPGYDPCFSADGDAVLLEAFADGTTSIWRLDLATRARRRLAEGHTPSASARGDAAWCSSGGSLWQLDLAADPVAARQITRGAYDRFASPSPDGATLLFYRQRDGAESLVELTLATGVERSLRTGRVDLPTYRP